MQKTQKTQKTYTHAELKKRVDEAAKNISTLYKKPCVNWTGQTEDKPKEKYSEVIARYLLDGGLFKTLLAEIEEVARKQSYIVESHTGCHKGSGNRHEEQLCLQLYRERTCVPDLGYVIDYQTPLKGKLTDDGIGKIDLLIWNEEDNRVNLVELKHGKNSESLLRAILELATYKQQINEAKLKTDIKNSKRIRALCKAVVDAKEIGACVIATYECNAYKEMGSDDFKYVKLLAKQLGIDLLRFDIGNHITLNKPRN